MGSASLFAFSIIAAWSSGVQGALVAVNVALCFIILSNSSVPPKIINLTRRAFSILLS